MCNLHTCKNHQKMTKTGKTAFKNRSGVIFDGFIPIISMAQTENGPNINKNDGTYLVPTSPHCN